MTDQSAPSLEAAAEALARLDKISRWTASIQLVAGIGGALLTLIMLSENAYGTAAIVALLTPLVWLLGYVVELQVTTLAWRADAGR